MICLVICTEGENSEPAAIREFSIATTGQTYPEPDIIMVPLKGNRGHKRLFDVADAEIEELKQSASNSILSEISVDDIIEKWVICDYDKMERNGITEQEFRKLALEKDYKAVINKPNFEFFVLVFLTNFEYAIKIKPSDYESEINKAIQRINERNISEKKFSSLMKIPEYSKNKYAAEKFFGNLLNYNPELIDNFLGQDFYRCDDCYSEMAIILRRIREIVKINS